MPIPEENANKPEAQQPSTPSTDVAAELAALKKQAQEATDQAQQAQQYMQAVKDAASGNTTKEAAVKTENDQFLDQFLSNGQGVLDAVVSQRLQQEAYFNGLRSTFQKENPHLEPIQSEVFGMANSIVSNAKQKGEPVTWESALKASRDHYDDKHKRMLKIAGADATPGHGSFNPNSRYAGAEVDYFGMDDKEFKQVMDKKDNERKARNRGALSNYGHGR